MDETAPTTEPNGTVPATPTSVLDDHDDHDQTASMNAVPPAAPWYDVPLARSRTDRTLGGVLSGICRAHGFDTRTTRIAFAVVALVLPVLVLAYLAAWALLPVDPAAGVSPRQLVTERRRRPLMLALGVVLASILLGSIGSWWFVGEFPWGLGLIAAGVLVWLLSSRRTGSSKQPPAPTAGPAEPTSAGAVTPAVTVPNPSPQAFPSPAAGRAEPAEMQPSTEPASPSRRRIPVASITLVAVAVLGTIAQVGENLDWWNIRAGAAIVTGLAVMLVATIVSAIVNRSRLLFVAVAALAIAIGGFALADPALDGPIGQRTIELTAGSNTAVHWQQAVGQLRIDLRDLDLSADGGEVTTIAATVGVGQLLILVHDDIDIEFSGAANLGQILLDYDEVAAGARVRHEVLDTAPVQPSAGTVRLDLEVGVGQIKVVRTAADA